METITKKDLVEVVKDELATTHEEAKNAVEVILTEIKNALKDGKSVTIHGFGTFVVKDRAERTGFNPITKERIIIPACKSVQFKPSGQLKDDVNHK